MKGAFLLFFYNCVIPRYFSLHQQFCANLRKSLYLSDIDGLFFNSRTYSAAFILRSRILQRCTDIFVFTSAE